MKKTVLVFALLIFCFLLLFQLSKYSLISGDWTLEIAISIIAILFFFIGLFVRRKKTQQIKELSNEIDSKKLESLEITNREYEVLKGIEAGLSNKEIGEKLFLSESTVKSHVSSIFLKLNAKRRTQAIQIARELNII
ncbi:MAG: response regulator transcription factor [Bacteroidota bacterium]